tara:strand:+ start:492 stop:1403 length:912 start_codon:yes stop_codon:yes gene_type:complete
MNLVTKTYIKLLIIFLISPGALAQELNIVPKALEAASDKISEFTSGLIPGEGYTETSIDLRENHKPDYSILAVRELLKIDSGNIFTQFSLFNTEQNNKERVMGNIGLGTRKLLNDNTLLVGFNGFLDNDFSDTSGSCCQIGQNRRVSLGFEVRNAVLDFHSNIYQGIHDTDNERVLDGWDYQLASQVPYLHWSKVFVNHYEWDGVLRDDIKGTKLGSEMILTRSLNLEVAYDDKDKKGLEDEWYAKIQFVHPPRNDGPTALDGISNTAWKENKDMSGELVSKVKRNNKIMIEFKGTTNISRLD